MLRFLLLANLIARLHAQPVPPMPPQSGYVTPPMREVRSLQDSTAAASRDWRLHFEQSSYTETGSYDEALAFCRRLERASSYARLLTLGRTPQGRELVTLIVSKDHAFTPEAARRTGKPIVLVQNGIHAGEIGGKDASLMFLRDVLVNKRHAAWLDHVILMVMPVFNVDGHERTSPYHRINQNGPRATGFRATAQRYNLNRDYVKADAPEMRLWLRQYVAWLPHLLIDNHVTDGADLQYDITLSSPTEQDVAPTVGAWTRDAYRATLDAALERDGHVVGPYVEPVDFRDRTKGFVNVNFSPRYSNGYAALQNRASLLVEIHSLKPYATQVWAHYDILRRTLEVVAAQPKALVEAVAAGDRVIAAHAGRALHVAGETDSNDEPFTYRAMATTPVAASVSGAPWQRYTTEPLNVPTRIRNRLRTTAAPVVPRAYAIPAEWAVLADLLTLHGVRTERIAASRTDDAEVVRFQDVRWSSQPFEGRHLLSYKTTTNRERRALPAGTILVPMSQRAARVAFHLLEPEAPDALVRWGFLNTVFEQKEYFSEYVFQPIAAAMLERDAALRAEFDKRVREDTAFAANPRERLLFLYRRSPYYEADKDLYPVLRLP